MTKKEESNKEELVINTVHNKVNKDDIKTINEEDLNLYKITDDLELIVSEILAI